MAEVRGRGRGGRLAGQVGAPADRRAVGRIAQVWVPPAETERNWPLGTPSAGPSPLLPSSRASPSARSRRCGRRRQRRSGTGRSAPRQLPLRRCSPSRRGSRRRGSRSCGFAPAGTARNWPLGTPFSCPAELLPQQARVPSARIAQLCRRPRRDRDELSARHPVQPPRRRCLPSRRGCRRRRSHRCAEPPAETAMNSPAGQVVALAVGIVAPAGEHGARGADPAAVFAAGRDGEEVAALGLSVWPAGVVSPAGTMAVDADAAGVAAARRDSASRRGTSWMCPPRAPH